MCVIFLVAIFFSNSNIYAWDSKEYSNGPSTHTLIAEQGLIIMKNDLPKDYGSSLFKDTLSKFEQHIDKFKEGSVSPDFGKKNYSMYQDHFYDPDTKTNFTARYDIPSVIVLNYVNETALSRFQQYYGEALYKWRQGSYADAVSTLGMAYHYLADLCEPHHSSNAIGGPFEEPTTKHTQFEQQVEVNKESFKISTLNNFGKYETMLEEECIADMIQSIAHDYARQSKPYYNVLISDYDANFNHVATETMKLAQESAARFIFRFLTDASNATPISGQQSYTLSVNVKTKDVDWAGTDDWVYFGVELKDGRLYEWVLDNWGNDFERGSNGRYTVTFPASSGSEINRVWIWKYKPAAQVSDGWHIQDISVSGNEINFYKQIDHFIDSNYGFYMKVSNGEMEQHPVY